MTSLAFRDQPARVTAIVPFVPTRYAHGGAVGRYLPGFCR